MTNSPVTLKGAVLMDCHADGDSLDLSFDSKRRLIVHNNWMIRGPGGKEVAGVTLVGRTVTDMHTSESALRLEFGGAVLEVDLSSDAWKGPEAAVFYEDGRPVTVWT
jgi:hypothetical protein